MSGTSYSTSANECPSTSAVSVFTECFASPPEPRFHESQSSITAELLQDYLELLTRKNEATINSATPGVTTLFKDRNTVLFLFELCRQLGLTTDVQYRAVELFHRFMVGHIEELYAHVQNSAETGSPITWRDVEERLKHQVTLRAVSCVQLASKLSSHYHLVTLNRARIFLSKCGFRYAATSIVQSEVRVLKTIKFRVHNPTPLEFIETLLGALDSEDDSLPVKQLHGISLKVLDIFYLSRESIFTNFAELIKSRNNTRPEDIEKLISGLCVDSMLLAAAIITAASLVIYEAVDTQWLMSALCEAAGVESRDIIDYSLVLMREVFSDDDSKT